MTNLLVTSAAPAAPAAPWRPIGEVLVDAGAITRDELNEALNEQRRTGQRLGEVLIEAGRISWLSLAQAIADQTTSSAADHEQFVDSAAFLPPTSTEPSTVAAAVETDDPEAKLKAVEALLRERQRAFIELVSTTETLRRRVADLESALADRNADGARRGSPTAA